MLLLTIEKELSGLGLSDFQTTDLDGNTVTWDILRDHDVTMADQVEKVLSIGLDQCIMDPSVGATA